MALFRKELSRPIQGKRKTKKGIHMRIGSNSSFLTTLHIAHIPRAENGGQAAFNALRETNSAPLSLGAQKRVEHFGLQDPLVANAHSGRIDVHA